MWGGPVKRRPVGSFYGYCLRLCLELQPASVHQPLGGGSGLAIYTVGLAIYTGLAFNTGVGEIDDLSANVGVGVRRGTDGVVDLL